MYVLRAALPGCRGITGAQFPWLKVLAQELVEVSMSDV